MRWVTAVVICMGSAGCSPDPVPSLKSFSSTLYGQKLPKVRSAVSGELIASIAEKLRTAVDSQRSFKNWRCTVGQYHAFETVVSLSCLLEGFRSPRVFLRDSSIKPKSDVALAVKGADRGDRFALSGEIGTDGPNWADLSIENCGLDLHIPAENAIFIEVDLQAVR